MMFGPTSYATIAMLLEKNISIFVAGELACFSAWQPHLLPRGLNMFHKSWMLKWLYQRASNTYVVKRPEQCSQKGFSLVPISSRTCLSSTTAGICKFSLTITILTSSKKKEKNEPLRGPNQQPSDHQSSTMPLYHLDSSTEHEIFWIWIQYTALITFNKFNYKNFRVQFLIKY